jgi:hypothetical protein
MIQHAHEDENIGEFDRRVELVAHILRNTLDRIEETNLVSLLAVFQCVRDLCKNEPRESVEALLQIEKEMCLGFEE